MAEFTATQGRYLAFIHAYTSLHGCPPAESEIGAALCVSPPSVNQMVKQLEKKGLISREPGRPRSLQVLIPDAEIPPWNNRKSAKKKAAPASGQIIRPGTPAPPANLYVLTVFLVGGPTSKRFANKEISRVIEIRGDQTLEQLHHAIFHAYDRYDNHLYEFQFGKRPYDPDGPNYSPPDPLSPEKGNAVATKLEELDLKVYRAFGYLFDFGDEWFHQIQVERIEQAIPTVRYPRVVKRVGKSPPQYGKQ